MRHAGPQDRNTYVDLVRFVAIAVVILGHWLATIIVVEDGRPRGLTALAEVGYMRWLTLLLQVMPMFFFAGGYAAAASWPSWRSRGGRWAGWTHARFVRLLRPTTWFIVIMTTASAIAMVLGAPAAVLAQAGWGVALQLWFLPVYLLLLVLAVPMIVAWQRVGWLVLAAAIAIVAVVDVLVRGLGITAAGWVSYLVAPAAGLLLGVAWHAGALVRRSLPIMLIVGGVATLLVLVAGLGYPPWMVGVPGEPPANTAPPNLALVAYSAAQVGLVLLLERPGRHLLERPRVLATVARGNAVIMTMYLWHMVPVLIVAALLAATGLPAGPTPGGAAWWALRLVWFAILGTILAVLVRLASRFERPSPPLLGLSGRLPSVLILACAALAGYALARLAVGGFAPAGHLPLGVLAAYAAGLTALWAAGTRARPASCG
jgi:fucose 4-O-acetylase-like acetyltransferase